MELRVLQYFLAVAREQSISGAAAYLNLTQPTLSRQLKDLEDELGKQLMIRGKRNRKITLTEEGILLRKRAEEIIDLVTKTENEIMLTNGEDVSGDIYIGTAETDAVRVIARVAKRVQSQYPDVHFHIISGDAVDILDRTDKGLLDFAIVLGHVDQSKYEYLELPMRDTWGVLMRKDSELANQEVIYAEDLWDKPLIFSRQALATNEHANWFKTDLANLNIVATYNLIYNASLMVDEGMGYALGLDRLINTTGKSNLCFKPFAPKYTFGMDIRWKKYQIFSKASKIFITYLQEYLAGRQKNNGNS